VRISKTRDYAIVTGDIIASSRLSVAQRRDLHGAMSRASSALRRAFKTAVPVPIAIFRGDSWQLLVTDPVQALRIALFYRASLRAEMGVRRLDTRMVIAIGRIDFIPGEQIAEGDGPAYRLSGRALESMHRRESMRLVYPSHPEERALGVVVFLLDALVSRWSDKQALAVTGALRGWSQEQIAKKIWREPISQQAVAQHLDRAAWSYVESALGYFEETLTEPADTQKNL
jgi:hypothetical protein